LQLARGVVAAPAAGRELTKTDVHGLGEVERQWLDSSRDGGTMLGDAGQDVRADGTIQRVGPDMGDDSAGEVELDPPVRVLIRRRADSDDIGLVHRYAAHTAVLKHGGAPLKITGFAVLQPNHRHLLPSCLHFDSTTVLEYCQQRGRNFLAPLGRNFLAPRAALNRTPDTAATAGPAHRTTAQTPRRP